MQKSEKKGLKPWHMGTHLRVLGEGDPMNNKLTGFRWLSNILHPCALDESSLSIGRVNTMAGMLNIECPCYSLLERLLNKLLRRLPCQCSKSALQDFSGVLTCDF